MHILCNLHIEYLNHCLKNMITRLHSSNNSMDYAAKFIDIVHIKYVKDLNRK